MFDGSNGEFGDHEDETHNKLEWVCADIFNIKVVEVIRIQVRPNGDYGVMYESNYFYLPIEECMSERI